MTTYFKRLIKYTKHDDVKKLFQQVDDLNLANAVVLKVGAITEMKYRQFDEKQQLAIYQQIKDALVTIKAKDTK
ncbi:TPA: hypothetical protein NGT37_001035 [Vibrio parahaemolyticus]|nr:hypothetical protein [Vibrio parahaemolyticus]